MRTFALAMLVVFATTSCGGGIRPFAARPILWNDDDRRPFTPRPQVRFEPYLWDAVDHLVFRPVSELWQFSPREEAINVNALDEVPDSSWFENRISRRVMSSEEIVRGACEDSDSDVPGTWRIIGGKQDGATLGFVFEDVQHRRYVLKIDRPRQPEQATAADAIASAVYHAAGYHVPCNRVVGFTEEQLVLTQGARIRGEPMRWGDVEEVLEGARRFPDGRYRAVVSRLVEGTPLGPWSYLGVREDDPNDVVPHEARRELRGMMVLNAWLNHWDARDNNTLSTWVASGGAGYVRHYLLDFGECFGLIEGSARRVRRFGHTQWLDAQHISEDALTFGLLGRPWQSGELGPGGETLGYFAVEGFQPDQWRPDYWNGAFERHTERDAAWMARIIARFSRTDLEALVRLGRYSDPVVEQELLRILAGRRRAILERYLTRLSPLTDAVLEDDQLCVTDLAVSTHLRWREDRAYESRAWSASSPLPAPALRIDDARVCAALPEGDHDYVIVELIASTVDRETVGPLRLHLARTPAGLALVGLERLDP